ncbi:MAG: DUF3124 domain-containing protein [Acidobacteriota bacterium]
MRKDAKRRGSLFISLWFLLGLSLSARQAIELSKGQSLYVPVYSHIYWGSTQRQYNLACTLSIRNVDPRHSLVVTHVDYHDTGGKKIRSYLEKPARIPPLGTLEYYIEEKDTQGGSGANFIVRWTSQESMNAPIVQTVMIGVEAAQGISFTCEGRAIAEYDK